MSKHRISRSGITRSNAGGAHRGTENPPLQNPLKFKWGVNLLTHNSLIQFDTSYNHLCIF